MNPLTPQGSWQHDHQFHRGNEQAERSTTLVMWITAATMVVEIAAGWWYNSMALLADGWHMSSHAVAIGLSVVAYSTARRYASDPRFAFGTWKIEILGGFASAVFLVGVALVMVFSSLERLFEPKPIHYVEAIVIAVLGLCVNLLCALILGKAQQHGHHDHAHHVTAEGSAQAHDHHHDLNLKSAYIHVLSDAATSILAIAALIGGWYCGWAWLDPVIGCLGAVLVTLWAKGLITDTGKVLLDREMDHPVVDEIRDAIETTPLAAGSSVHVTDLHVSRVGKSVYSCALTVVTDDSTLGAAQLRQQLVQHEEIVHSTIEIHYCVSP